MPATGEISYPLPSSASFEVRTKAPFNCSQFFFRSSGLNFGLNALILQHIWSCGVRRLQSLVAVSIVNDPLPH